jgi:hypothetical protein
VPLDREREREGLDHESTRMVDTRGDRHGRSTERHRRDLPPPRTPHQRERERERESERERGRECACVRERECERVPSPLTPHQRERERESVIEREGETVRDRESEGPNPTPVTGSHRSPPSRHRGLRDPSQAATSSQASQGHQGLRDDQLCIESINVFLSSRSTKSILCRNPN